MSTLETSFVVGPDLPGGLPSYLARALDRAIELNAGATLTVVNAAGVSRAISYDDLRSSARARWAYFQARGIRAGDVLLILGRDPYSSLECAWACFVGGATAAPVMAPLDFDHDVAAIKRISDALTILPQATVVAASDVSVDEQTLHRIAGRPVRLIHASEEPMSGDATDNELCDDPADALLLLTSGSTGLPKAVPLTHRQIIARSIATAIATPVRPGHVALNWMPLDHVGGIVMWHLSPLIAGCSQVQIATPYVSSDPLRWLELTDRYRASHLWAPNFAFGLVTERLKRRSPNTRWDLSCVDVIVNGGEAINAATARAFLETLEPYGLKASTMRPMWGMSETASGCVLADELRDDLQAGAVSVGRPIPGVSIRLVDEEGVIVPAGTVGVLEVRGDYVTDRYAVADAAANAAFVGGGWFSTGDKGVIVDGQLSLVGRSSETIIVNGTNYHPPALEMALEQSAWVRPGHVAVCGIRPAGADTDQAIVFVSPNAGETFTSARSLELQRTLMRQFGIRAREIVCVEPDAIPRTSLGKIQRKLLSSNYATGKVSGIAPVGAEALFSPLLVPSWQPAPPRPRDQRRSPTWTLVHLPETPEAPGAPAVIARSLKAWMDRGEIDRGSGECERTAGLLMVFNGEGEAVDLAMAIDQDRRLLLQSIGAAARTEVQIVVVQEEGGAFPSTAAPAVEARVAFLRNAASELPGLSVTVTYVQGSDERTLLNLIQVLEEGSEGVGALSGDRKHVRRYLPVAAPAFDHDQTLTQGGRYVITGSGEVSLALASLLVKELRAHVTLMSRRPDAPDALPAGCDYLSGDVTNSVDVGRMLRSVLSDGPIDGVFHLAAIASERATAELSLHEIRQAIAAKAIGIVTLVQNLTDLSPSTPLVAFSSLLASFHSPLYGAYVAANRYMEAFAERASPQIRCVAWGLIAGLGMSRGKPHGGHALALGFGRLEQAELMSGLRLALSLSEPVVLVGANPTGSKVEALVDMSAVDDPIGVPMAGDSEGKSGHKASATSAIDELTPLEMPLLEPIREIWRGLVKVPTIQLGDNFFSLGGDSLGLAELHARLCELTNRDLPIVPLFAMENLREVVRYAAGGHGGLKI